MSATPYAGLPPRDRPRKRSDWHPSPLRSSAREPPRPSRRQPASNSCPSQRFEEHADEPVLVGGRSLHLFDDFRGGALLEVPLRQVWLDHAVLAAVRCLLYTSPSPRDG